MEGKMFQYISEGIRILKRSLLLGVAFYIIILLFLWLSKKRRSFDLKQGVCEFFFTAYLISVLKITGIIGMTFYLKDVLHGLFQLNLIPFVGSSLKMILLNFLLFVPYGFLLPIVFNERKWSWKQALFIGFLSTITIEILQIFGGRFVEIDDIITNTFGTLTGFIIFSSMKRVLCRDSRKKGITQLVTLAGAIAISIISLSFVCVSEDLVSNVPILDGFMALEADSISEVTAYHSENTHLLDFHTFNMLGNTLANYSGCLNSEVETINETTETLINDADYFEIIKFNRPQNIFFENSDKIQMNNVKNIIFNFDNHMLYWGSEDDKYTFSIDYSNITDDIKEYSNNQFENCKNNLKELLKEN